MGPSGSGKSTLLHCLAGVLRPDRGEVWFDGRRVDELNDAARTELRRRSFGFVFQFGQLVPELTRRGERRVAAAAQRHPTRACGRRRPRVACAARAGWAWAGAGRGSFPAASRNGSRLRVVW